MSRRTKAERRELRECLAHGTLEPWSCYCTYGCDACEVHWKCTTCGRGHKTNTLPTEAPEGKP